jgi:hypothetical protein
MYKLLLKSILVILFFVFFTEPVFSQDEKDNSPVYSPWACSYLIDNQTVVTPEKGLLELVIHHRFGKISEISDLFGIYAPSNIRLGFNYGITNKLMLAVGTEKDNKMQELGWKYNILTQTKSNSMPIALTYYGNVNLDARDKEVFGEGYKFTHRMSFFHQLIVGRKFTDKFSLQLAGGYSHFNSVDSVNFNDYLGISAGGRYKIHNDISLIAEYDYALGLNKGTIPFYKVEPKPNYALGVEFGTGTHAFQLFVAQYKNIVNQKNMGYNLNDLADGHFLVGFNITVRFY